MTAASHFGQALRLIRHGQEQMRQRMSELGERVIMPAVGECAPGGIPALHASQLVPEEGDR